MPCPSSTPRGAKHYHGSLTGTVGAVRRLNAETLPALPSVSFRDVSESPSLASEAAQALPAGIQGTQGLKFEVIVLI